MKQATEVNRTYFVSQALSWKTLTQAQQEELYVAAKDYYYDDDEVMTDSSFDELEKHLKKIKSTIFTQANVGGGMGQLIHPHMSPMLSLDKIQVNDESNFPQGSIEDWANGNYPIEATPKFDGCAIEIQYNDGKLVQVLSRGKESKGKDITAVLKSIIPNTVEVKKRLEIRGEVLMTKKIFEKKYAGKKLCRSTVGGIINSGDGINDCTFIAYNLKVHEGNDYKFTGDTMKTLTKLGFNKEFPVKIFTINNKHDFRKAYDEFKHYREFTSPFYLDGHVLKVQEDFRKGLGDTNHHPRWAVAIKFPSQEVETKIIGCEFNVGYTGQISPVGLLDPVELDGSTIGRVSLYNKAAIEKSLTYPGAVVAIKKSGDIIPQIVAIIKPAHHVPANFFPTHCPSCNSKLVDDGTSLWCKNSTGCEAQLYKKLCNGIDALGLKGIGDSTAESLVKAGILSIFDFFNPTKLNRKDLIKSGMFKDGKELDTVVSLPLALKTIELSDVIRGLQFADLGKTGARQVAKYLTKYPDASFKSFPENEPQVKKMFENLEKKKIEPFLDRDSDTRKTLRTFIQVLRDRGIKITLPQDTSKLIGFEMTGGTDGAGFSKKDEFVKYLEKEGFHHVGLKDAKILFTDDLKSSSNKMKDAAKKGVQIMLYSDALDVDALKKSIK